MNYKNDINLSLKNCIQITKCLFDFAFTNLILDDHDFDFLR